MTWTPNSQFDFILMDNDVKDEQIIKQFVHFHNLPLIINDICEYLKKELNKYPEKITNRGMVVWTSTNKIELEFSKEINIYKFTPIVKNNNINYKLINGSKFSFLSLKNFLAD
jgi:hypothetical protein